MIYLLLAVELFCEIGGTKVNKCIKNINTIGYIKVCILLLDYT